MADVRPLHAPRPEGATGVVVFADGRTVWGQGFGAEGEAVGELCFNTAMTGYQEVMTDPSYAKQVIAFTFPHIGNVGANDEDVEAAEAHALGCLVREVVTEPSNYRANQGFADWMRKWGRIGIAGRGHARADQAGARAKGRRTIAIAHRADGQFDLEALQRMAAEWPGLEGMDLAKEVSRLQVERWSGGKWDWPAGYEISPYRLREGKRRAAPKGWVCPASPRPTRPPPGPLPQAVGGVRAPRRRGRLWLQAQHLPQPVRSGGAGDDRAGDRDASTRSWRTSPTVSSCRTARATRRRRANMRCR